ncbi:3054_t:CDS:2 [Racocetra fulgida]|uniref:3054_t:CDS:1 n=1 Tax=Racocetra fulgida TaxID=60492 RepID=A0A9N8ZFY0_9GLOM|nr:3054_t:CDS:2 [Racocetra fulgida]
MQIAFDNGINYFDTAEVYSGGKSEIDMGFAIKRLGWSRSGFVISTKIFWGGKGPNDRGLSRKHIVEGLSASLQRLGLDYVDIVYAHRSDPDTVQYNLFHRERVEKEYVPLFNNYKMGAAVWSPLAGGVLTGKHNDHIDKDSRFALEDNTQMEMLRDGLLSPEGQLKIEKVKRLMPVAERIRVTPAQLALAWCMKQPNVDTVITGVSKPEQMIENLKAVNLISKLTPEILKEIDDIMDNRPQLQFSFRDC